MFAAQPFGSGRLYPCLGLLAALVLSGCAQVYDVKVDARQNPEIKPGYSYRLVTKPMAGGGDEAREKRTEAMVHKALAGHGMYEAEHANTAEVTVEVSVEVGIKRVVAESVDSLETPEMSRLPPPETRIVSDSKGQAFAISRDSHVDVREIHEKKITIVAREGPGAVGGGERPPRELWRVEAKVDDEGEAIDKVLPVLVGAAVDHIDSDSTSQRTKRVSEKSEPVDFVKGGT